MTVYDLQHHVFGQKTCAFFWKLKVVFTIFKTPINVTPEPSSHSSDSLWQFKATDLKRNAPNALKNAGKPTYT